MIRAPIFGKCVMYSNVLYDAKPGYKQCITDPKNSSSETYIFLSSSPTALDNGAASRYIDRVLALPREFNDAE